MTSSRPVQLAFSSGELSPLLHSRSDYQRFQTGLAKCRGFLPLREGGITRAPGTIYRGTTRNNAYARRIPFQFSEEDALELEFTDGFMRVWRYGELVQSGGSPYELATGFVEASLDNLVFVQSADVIYMVDGLTQIQKLSRFALDNWTIADADFVDGPFSVQNLTESKTIRCSGTTGSITLTGSGTSFDSTWVGSLLMIEPTDYSSVALWTGNTNINVGDLMRYGDNIYRFEAGNNTGVNPPIHTSGTRLVDLTNGTKWKWISDTTGIVKITSVASATSATATVLRTVPQPCVDDPTYRWAEGAWSDRYGYPTALEIHGQRLYAGFTPSEPRTIWGSAIGAPESHLPGALADDAFAYTISGSETLNRGNWLRKGKKGFYIGALGEVFRAFSSDAGQAIGAETFDMDVEGTNGCSRARPIAPYGYPIYITKDKSKVEELRYSFEVDGGKPKLLSLTSQHFGAEGFEEIVWQSSPQGYAWLRRGNGDLAVLLYDPDEDVLGWALVPVAGGVVEDLTVSTDASSGNDILTLIVRRTINSQTVRMVEEQAVIWGVVTEDEPIHKAVHLFASTVFDLETPQTTFSVPHLEGQTVYVWTNQGEFGPLTVPAGGDLVLKTAVDHAVIGLLDETHKARTLDIQAAAEDGNSTGRFRKLDNGGGVIVHQTAAGNVRAVTKQFGKPEILGDRKDIVPRGVGADLTDAYSGSSKINVQTGYTDAVALEFEPVGGAPMTITGLIPNVNEAGP